MAFKYSKLAIKFTIIFQFILNKTKMNILGWKNLKKA